MQHEGEAARKGTHLLQLHDDTLGLIYKHLKLVCPSSAKALRQSCSTAYRSPSINACIQSLTVSLSLARGQRYTWQRDSWPEEQPFLDDLAAYPKHATLKALTIRAEGLSRVDNSLNEWHALMFGPSGQTCATARRRASTVQELTLERFTLRSGSAAALCGLFPKLCDSTGPGGRLVLKDCVLDDSFLGELARAGARITDLALIDCFPESRRWGPCLCSMTALRSLQALHLKLGWATDVTDLNIHILHRLPQLQQLILDLGGERTPKGLPELLQSVSLHRLALRDGNVTPPSDERCASSTLQELELSKLSLGMPKMKAADFPALQQCRFNGLWLECSADTAQQQVEGLVAWASALLQRGVRLGPLSETEDTKLMEPFALHMDVSWPGLICLRVLETLVPLQPALKQVHSLRISGSDMTCPLASAGLCSLFCGLRRLEMTYDVKFDVAKNLQEIIKGLPALEWLQVCLLDTNTDIGGELPEMGVVQSVQTALSTCRLVGRPFTLVLDVTSFSDVECKAKLLDQDLMMEWESKAEQQGPLRSCDVRLIVRNEDCQGVNNDDDSYRWLWGDSNQYRWYGHVGDDSSDGISY